MYRNKGIKSPFSLRRFVKKLTIARARFVKKLTNLKEEEIFAIIFLEKEKKGLTNKKEWVII